jgi:hypothetical protein
VLGSVEGAGDGVGDVGEWDAAVGVVGCAGVPGEFAVVGDVEGAPVGLVRVGDGQVGDGTERVVDLEVGVAVPAGDGESVAGRQEQFDDLGKGLVGEAARVPVAC